jgi:hypothetical protein
MTVPAVTDLALPSGSAREMILVQRLYGLSGQHVLYLCDHRRPGTLGSEDPVSYIDSHYRTIARRPPRPGGHSLGFYGTIKIARKHPEAFSSI